MSTESEREPLSRRQKSIVACVVLAAFILRLIYVLEARANPYFDEPIMDPLFHLEWARALVAGETFQEGPFFRAPLYPWFLGTLLRFFGDGLLLPRVVQAGLGALATLFTFLIGWRAFRFRAGIVAAVLVAINWVLIYFDGELLIPTLAIPLDLCALWLSMRLADRPSARNAGAAGLAWGVAALARPNVLLFMPLLFAWVLLRQWPHWKGGLWRALALTGGVLAPILPITAYNSMVGNDHVLISSQSGVNLWIGNNPDSDGSTAIVPGTRPGWWAGYHDSITLAEQAAGARLKPSEVSAHYSSKALDFFMSEPAAALEHMLWKLRLFWTDWELGNNADVHFCAMHFSRLMRILPPSFGLLGPLALLGLWACRKSPLRLLPLWGFCVTYTASVVMYFVCSRYRAPVLPVFAILSGTVLVGLYDNLRARQWKPLGLSLLCFGVLAALMQQMPPGLDRTEAKGLWALGIHEMAADRPRQAQEYYRQSLQANPGYWIAHRDLGIAQQSAGDLRDAQETFLRALSIKPGDLEVTNLLVDVCIARKDLPTAQAAARESLRTNPAFPKAYDAMARVHIANQQWQQAREVLGEGLQRGPEDFFCNFRLGAIELQTNNPCAAVEPFSRAVKADNAPTFELYKAAQGALQQAKRDCQP